MCCCCCCYVIFLLICNCGCTVADEQQEQQCETLTTATESNLHKLLSVVELIFHIDLRSDGPLTNRAHLYRAPTTPGQYDLLQIALVPSADGPPTNWAHLYRALLHQDSMTYYRMHWYLVPIDPSPLLIESTCTEPYYTRTVWPIPKCIGT